MIAVPAMLRTAFGLVTGKPKTFGGIALVVVVGILFGMMKMAQGQRDDAREDVRSHAGYLTAVCSIVQGDWNTVPGQQGWPKVTKAKVEACAGSVARLKRERNEGRAVNGALNERIDQLIQTAADWEREHALSQRRVAAYENSVRTLAADIEARAAREATYRDLLEQSEVAMDWHNTAVPTDVAKRLRVLTRRASAPGGPDRANPNRTGADASGARRGPEAAGAD